MARTTTGERAKAAAPGSQHRSGSGMEVLKLVVMYPTFFLALGGAGKTAVDIYNAWRTGLPVSSVGREAQQQSLMQTTHSQCAYAAPTNAVKEKPELKMGANVCDNGDVAIVTTDADGTHMSAWFVSLDTVRRQHIEAATAFEFPSLISASYAQVPDGLRVARAIHTVQAAQTAVLCQKPLESGKLLRRIKVASGCFDEVVNTFTGQVISSTPAQCTPNCG